MTRKALVTLCVGEPYKSLFYDFAYANWKTYAAQHGYELFVFDELLDTSARGLSRPPHWQKLIALSHPNFSAFDRLVWIDSDIVVNPTLAPDICEVCPRDKIGVVSDQSQPTWAEARSIFNIMPSSAQLESIYVDGLQDTIEEVRRRLFFSPVAPEFQTAAARQQRFLETVGSRGIECESPLLFNSGVLVTSPEFHAQVFQDIYDKYENLFAPLNDNIPLIVELSRREMLFSIDSRFNVLFLLELFEHYPFLLFKFRESDSLLRLAASTIFMRSFFLHFAASYPYMPYLALKPKTWLDFVDVGLPSKLRFPNRESPDHRFLAVSSEDPEMSVDALPLPVFERNYLCRYAPTPLVKREPLSPLVIVFDERLAVDGFYNVERTRAGNVIRWTGRGSYCCFAIEQAIPESASFLLMIKFEGGLGIAEAAQLSVNDISCEGLRVRSASDYSEFLREDENIMIEGRMPLRSRSPYTFRIRHPYVTSMRSAGSSDSRQLGLALTRIVFLPQVTGN